MPIARRRNWEWTVSWITDPQIWIAFLTLTALEIVLGIDNIVFISIQAGRLPPGQRGRARTVGLALAMITRVLLLLSLAWMIRLTEPLFTVKGNELSGRDLILLVGGLFLIFKSTREIHSNMAGDADHAVASGKAPGYAATIFQILLIDLVFSLDSVITAVGMVEEVGVMVAAVVVAVVVMMMAAGRISDFVEAHPTVKMLALSFLMMIGVALIADGLDLHIPKGYIYFAMGFSVMVECFNLKASGRRDSA